MTLVVETLSNGDTVDATTLNAIVADIIGAMFSIGDDNLDAEKPLGKDKIAARYQLHRDVIPVVPASCTVTGTVLDFSATGQAVISSTRDTVVGLIRDRLASGEKRALVLVEARCLGVSPSNGHYPALGFWKADADGTPVTLVGGNYAILNSTTAWREVYRSNPTKNPLMYIQDLDNWAITLGADDNAESGVDVRGVTLQVWTLHELVSK